MTKIKKWQDLDLPWVEIDDFHDIIIDKIDIIDILDRYKIKYFSSMSGEFSYKLKCPLPNHLGGNERTASFYVSKDRKSFFCFGCNSRSNVIDFISLYNGIPYYEALKLLATYAGITKDNILNTNPIEKIKKDPEKTVANYVYKSGIIIRDFLSQKESKDKWNKWADKRFNKLDSMLNKLKEEEWEIAKEYYEKIIKYLEKQ